MENRRIQAEIDGAAVQEKTASVAARQAPHYSTTTPPLSAVAIRVCAVMITLNPQPETLNNIDLLLQQVSDLIVVDNGSNPATLEMLRIGSRRLGFTLTANEQNTGIAAALNTGVRQTLGKNFPWVLLFDQDSTITAGYVAAMFEAYANHPRRDEVAIFCPSYVDRATGDAVLTSKLDSDGGPIVAMTSGSLMPAWVFERCGDFLEELFIDQVDVEYCFRIRHAGYTIAGSPQARLLHAAGSPRKHRPLLLASFGSFRATHHSVARRYYITRNRLWVAMKFRSAHPRWCVAMLRSIFADTIKLVLVEDAKIAKLRATFLGILDGCRGRLGKTWEI